MKISVIICTHNPRRDYLERTLQGLAHQSLPRDQWELIIVDNNSTPALATWPITQQHGAVLLTESEQGFTPALLQGLAHTRSDLCLLLHDDNVLPSNYLGETLRIAQQWKHLGAWGGGYEPEFESEPSDEVKHLLTYLAIHPITKDRWSNALYDYGATPCGAGMTVRTPVLQHWARHTEANGQRKALGRNKERLTSCEDFDIAFTAIDLGLGTAVFSHLRLTHLIPRHRVQKDYLLRLAEGHAYSSVHLHSFRGHLTPPASGPIRQLRYWYNWLRLSSAERELRAALTRGEARGFATLAAPR
jgi:glycosyltransferase involved in cell wall biosynthesis